MTADISLILILSLIVWGSPFIGRMARLPTPAVEILLGSILATFKIIHENSYFDMIAEVGFLYLMFLAGMEVNLKQLLRSPPALIRRSLLFVLALGVFAVSFGILLDFNIIIIVSLPLISVGLLASLSKIYGKKERWINLAFTVGVMGEVASILALTILDAASVVGFSDKLLIKLLILSGFAIMIVLLYKILDIIFWWYPELKHTLMPRFDNSDQDIRLSMALFFILVAVMIALHLEMALGAFLAGIAISAFFHHEKKLEEKMSSLGFGFLVPLFFIHVGSTFDLHSLAIPSVLRGSILITVVMILIRILAAYTLKHYAGAREALTIAFALSMPLTLLIAVATIGYNTHYIGILVYNELILAALFEIIISMTAIKIIRPKWKKKEEEKS